jgi:hypothetical protein
VDADDLRPVRPFGTPWTVGRMVADTCIWISWQNPDDPEQPVIEELLRLRREARIDMAKTDTVDTERTESASIETATQRVLETAGIIELHGPLVLDHSRLDHAVLGGTDDADRLDQVFAVLFPNGNRFGTDRASRHNLRDATHVATSIRYGYDGFVTTESRLLNKGAAIQREWNIEILSPSAAVQWVERRIERERVRTADRNPESA